MNSNGSRDLRVDNLPHPLSSFIGRKQEFTELERLLSASRLLTLIGPGGAGKTRLAIHAAHRLLNAYADRIWLVEFASLTEGERVPQAVANVLDLRETKGEGITNLITEHLGGQRALLLLDNCEHLAPACAQFASTILAACPRVSILATSRAPLGVSGEVVFGVPPLSLPEPQPWRQPDADGAAMRAYKDSEAVQLFIERALAADPEFEFDLQNGPWVADICRRLDGIPLAIELAAARVRSLSVRQISERLVDRFQLLTSPIHSAPDRHQTLEAALDWSYALLSEAEQALLCQLAIFSNGWTLAAAESVCILPGEGPGWIAELHSGLVDKSLVVARRVEAGMRYSLLETIRQYALQKLAGLGEAQAVRGRHMRFFTTWAEEGAQQLEGAEQARLLECFDREHDNLRAALEWNLTSGGDPQAGLRLVCAVAHFWKQRGFLSEGRARLKAALEHDRPAAAALERAWAYLWSANLAYLQSDYPATRQDAEVGLRLCRGLGPQGLKGVARALDTLGELATETGDYAQAPQYFEDAMAIYRDLEDRSGQADMLLQLGWAAMRRGDYERAGEFLNEALPFFKELNQGALVGLALSGLGELAVRERRFEEAQGLLIESLDMRRELGDRWGMAGALGSLGWVALLQRDFKRMRALLSESLGIRSEIGDLGGTAWCLEKLGEALVLEAKLLPSSFRREARRRALRIFGAAQALREPVNSVIDPADQDAYQRTLNDLRRAFGEKAFELAWREGRELPVASAIELGLDDSLVSEAADKLPEAQTERLKFGGLSPREREAALLIAQGKTNREIAEIMVVRTKTIETYVTRILNKLGFDSRVQIAAWVHDLDPT